MNPGTIDAIAGGLVVCITAPRPRCRRRPSTGFDRSIGAGTRAVLIGLIGCVGLSIAWYLGLRQLAAWGARDLGQSRYLVMPSAIFWAIPSLLLGIVSPVPLIFWLSKSLFQKPSEPPEGASLP